MEKEKDSKLKQAMKGLDSFLTTHYSFRYNQITEQCEFHDKHKFDKYRVVDEREFNTLVINAIEEGVNCMTVICAVIWVRHAFLLFTP
jgi:virulence-associated protein E